VPTRESGDGEYLASRFCSPVRRSALIGAFLAIEFFGSKLRKWK
jgi:hypothetical protein